LRNQKLTEDLGDRRLRHAALPTIRVPLKEEIEAHRDVYSNDRRFYAATGSGPAYPPTSWSTSFSPTIGARCSANRRSALPDGSSAFYLGVETRLLDRVVDGIGPGGVMLCHGNGAMTDPPLVTREQRYPIRRG